MLTRYQKNQKIPKSFNYFNQSPASFIYKNVKFNLPITNRTLKKLLNHYADTIFQQSEWQLSQFHRYLAQIHLLFPFIAATPCPKLSIQKFSPVKICPLISHIYFPQLITLKLQNNNITNIQSLAYMNCPQLQTLDLSNNKISNLKPLLKTVLKKLVNLYAVSNQYSEVKLDRLLILSNINNEVNLQQSSNQQYKISKLVFDIVRNKFYDNLSSDLALVFVKLQNSKVNNDTIRYLIYQEGVRKNPNNKKIEFYNAILRKFTIQPFKGLT